MRVRLTTDRFGGADFDMQLEQNRIVFFEGTEEKQAIALNALRYFGMEGQGTRRKHFVLETDGALYEGMFLNDADASQFVHCLQTVSGCHMNISLDTFKDGRSS